MKILLLITIVILLACWCSGCASVNRAAANPGSHAYALVLPAGLVQERAVYTQDIDYAIGQVIDRFTDWGYTVPPDGFLRRVLVFGTAAEMKQGLAKAFSTDTANIPDSFGGTVGDSTFYLVSRELFHPIWEQMYPGWPWSEEVTYRSLIVHEIAHSEHAYIARTQFGSEDAMGPEWFFEGLAMVCAGQFPLGERDQTPLSDDELAQFLNAKDRPAVTYPQYARMVQTLLLRHPVKELMEHGLKDTFPQLLEKTKKN